MKTRYVFLLTVLAIGGLLAASVLIAAPQDGKEQIASANSPFNAQFDQFWGDSKAEMAGYELTYPRYGQLRKGTAVTIFVTEPFSNSARVKADPGKHPPEDEFPVLKLNLVEDFPTGIYDYNMMTSVFTAMKPANGLPAGTPTKISFGAQEWCGHVYEQTLFDSRNVHYHLHSYFDGEADQQDKLDMPRNGISEDALLFWARGLGYPFMSAGETREVPMLRSLKVARLQHVPLAWLKAKLTRHTEAQKITVPAGEFDVEVATAAIEGDRTWTFYVERAHPHRIIKWQVSDGQTAELLGADRLQYWSMNKEGGQAALEKLGLKPR